MAPGAWGPNPPESFTFSLSPPKIPPKNPNDIEYLCNQLFFHYESHETCALLSGVRTTDHRETHPLCSGLMTPIAYNH